MVCRRACASRFRGFRALLELDEVFGSQAVVWNELVFDQHMTRSGLADEWALVRVVDLLIVVWVTCPCGRSGQVLDQLVRM